MLTDKIQEKLRELSTLPNVTTVGLGKKTVGGNQTDVIGITFGVKVKEDNPENVLPTSVDIDGVTYVTDVVETGEVTFTSCPGNVPITKPDDYIVSGMSIFSNYFNNSSNGNQVNNIIGTLGIVAYHPGRNILVGVTAGHMIPDISRSATITKEACTNFIFRSLMNGGAPNFSYGYGYVENLYFTNFFQQMGGLFNYAPLKVEPITNPNRFNQVDACLLYFQTSRVFTTVIPDTDGTPFEIAPYYDPSWRSYHVKGIPEITSPMPFATTAELDALITNPPSQVSSSGFGTGVKHGPVCGLKIDAIGVVAVFTTSSLSPTALPGTVYFDNLISFSRVVTPGLPVSNYGDSGAALIAKINNVWKIIGLVIGGTNPTGNDDTAYACRIDKIAEELEIEAWDGSIKPLGNIFSSRDIPNGSYLISPGINDAKKVVSGDRTYYQMGTYTGSAIIYYE